MILLMVDDYKTIRTGGGEGRGPAEILFLITVLLGGWLGVVARLIVARWSDLISVKDLKDNHDDLNDAIQG